MGLFWVGVGVLWGGVVLWWTCFGVGCGLPLVGLLWVVGWGWVDATKDCSTQTGVRASHIKGGIPFNYAMKTTLFTVVPEEPTLAWHFVPLRERPRKLRMLPELRVVIRSNSESYEGVLPGRVESRT